MPKKTPGKLHAPPDRIDFDKLPLKRLCRDVDGVFFRLHSVDPKTGNVWHPIHFSTRARTRFDPADGPGTLCVAGSVAGCLMEIFDDQWGAIGAHDRSLTTAQLLEWYVTRISLPKVELFDATGKNLSKIGADAQLITAAYDETRPWASRLATHSAQIDGILYSSRHDVQRENIALFRRPRFEPCQKDPTLNPAGGPWSRTTDTDQLIYGPELVLARHPDLNAALDDLEVAILP